MPLWLRKVSFVLITVLTLGIITPTYLYEEKAEAAPPSVQPSTVEDVEASEDELIGIEEPEEEVSDLTWPEMAVSIEDRDELVQQWVSFSVNHADMQSFEKFGPTISEKVGDQYRNEILPKIEEVIETLSYEVDEATLRNLVLSEDPANGLGEKIFHIYDGRTGKDLVRFHVRRDHPPKKGYWFNFHYHMEIDNYENHHELGKIFWDKNTPPKWMS